MLSKNCGKNQKVILILFFLFLFFLSTGYGTQDSFNITITVISLPIGPPLISNFMQGTQTLVSGDPIPEEPQFSVKITDDYGLQLKSIYFYINGEKVTDGLTDNRGYDYFNPALERAYYKPKKKLNPGTYSLKVSVRNTRGVDASAEVIDLKVAAMAEEVRLLEPPLVYPGVANPEKQPISFGYRLNKSAQIHLYLYDITRTLVWENVYPENTDGGKAGYNEVVWNGISAFGRMAENGVYFYQLVAEVDGQKKLIGRGRFTIYR
ncbi:MAG: hypothetical protein ACPL4K_03375 [Candidatus Margulisiibacteriota bacterium]